MSFGHQKWHLNLLAVIAYLICKILKGRAAERLSLQKAMYSMPLCGFIEDAD